MKDFIKGLVAGGCLVGIEYENRNSMEQPSLKQLDDVIVRLEEVNKLLKERKYER